MNRLHIILQTGYVPFFAQIADKSAAFFELANKNDLYVIIATIPEMYKIEKMLKLSGHANVIVLNCIDIASMSVCQIYDGLHQIDKYKQSLELCTLNILNGSCNAFLEMELSHVNTANWIIADEHLMQKQFKNISIAGSKPNVYRQLITIQQSIIKFISNVIKLPLLINNWIEDPLQNKLSLVTKTIYPTLIDINHWYFHNLDNELNCYTHQVYKNELLAIYTKFQFSPSQQFPYMHGLTFNHIYKYAINKTLNFAFSLTNVWKDRHERTGYIDAMIPYHNTKSVKAGIVFRFYSRDSNQQWLSDKLLPYETYIELIRQSRFTLIVPSYDANCFSMRRFFESLAVGCIPLVHADCKLYMFPKDMQDFIKNNLLVTNLDLQNLQEHVSLITINYGSLLLELFNQPWIQQYTKSEFYLESMKIAKLI